MRLIVHRRALLRKGAVVGLTLIAFLLASDHLLKEKRRHDMELQGTFTGLKSFTVVPSKCKVTDDTFDNIYKTAVWASERRGIEVVLDEFYNNASWPPKNRLSLSGGGSNRGEATMLSLQFLIETIKTHNIQSMIDVPSGDANWIFDSWPTDSIGAYLGLDIAKEVVEFNNQRFAHHSNKMFLHWDASECSLPSLQRAGSRQVVPFELVHARDVLQHLPLDSVQSFLCNVAQSGARIFVTTTFPDGTNTEIERGSFFRNNLEKPPFSFPEPNRCIQTHPNLESDLTCEYSVEKLKDFVQRAC